MGVNYVTALHEQHCNDARNIDRLLRKSGQQPDVMSGHSSWMYSVGNNDLNIMHINK